MRLKTKNARSFMETKMLTKKGGWGGRITVTSTMCRSKEHNGFINKKEEMNWC